MMPEVKFNGEMLVFLIELKKEVTLLHTTYVHNCYYKKMLKAEVI